MKKLLLSSLCLAGVGCGSGSEALVPDPSLAGLYQQTSTWTLSNEYPGVPAFETVTRSHGYAELLVDGERAYLKETFCRLESLEGPVHVVIPDALTRSIKTERVELELKAGAKGQTIYVLPERPIPVGARLEDPVHDPLPTTPDDPRVWDQDGDGKPGVTILIQGTETAELYMVRRERYTYEFEPVAPGRMKGQMRDRSEQIVIAASDPLLRISPKLTPSEDPTKTYVEYQRTPEGQTAPDCDAWTATP